MKNKFVLIFVFTIICTGFYSCMNEANDIMPTEGKVDTRSGNIYKYPSVNDIIRDSGVKSAMESAWSSMKNSASEKGRKEYGFFIYYDMDKKSYWCGSIVEGGSVSGCEGTNASINLGRVDDNLRVCAFFHCHTTLEYCPPTVSRTTGPSGSDESYASKYGIPGILYDYSVRTLVGGTSKNDPYTTTTFGPDKRADMPY